MCGTRSERFKEERILSVVFDRDLGLCVEFGDEKIDEDGIYGYAPTQGFIKALKKEIESHVRNTIGGLSEHPTLRRAHRRFRQGLMTSRPVFDESSRTTKIPCETLPLGSSCCAPIKRSREFEKPALAKFSFTDDKYKALEEIREILGFTEEGLRTFFAVLEKADDGYLDFSVGNVIVEFHKVGDLCSGEISMTVKVEQKEVTHTTEYQFLPDRGS